MPVGVGELETPKRVGCEEGGRVEDVEGSKSNRGRQVSVSREHKSAPREHISGASVQLAPVAKCTKSASLSTIPGIAL
jgi:hypothetical protein